MDPSRAIGVAFVLLGVLLFLFRRSLAQFMFTWFKPQLRQAPSTQLFETVFAILGISFPVGGLIALALSFVK